MHDPNRRRTRSAWPHLLALATLVAAACANPQVRDLPPPPSKPAPKAPEPEDAFSDFGGKKVDKGVPVRLEAADMVGINGHRVVIQLIKTEWTTRELANGKKLKEGTADLQVQKGDKIKRKRIDQEETRTVFGAKITVKGAGETYSNKRMDYVPWVEIVVN